MKIELAGRGGDIVSCDFFSEWMARAGMNGEGTAEGFADDLTILFKMSVNSVNSVIGIMNSFELVSGLRLNVKKTQLMITGTDLFPVGTKISDIEIVDKVKILGVSIDRKLENLNQNWEEKIVKMNRLYNFWNLQKMSIAGRIMVAKTYLMSQVVFLLDTLPIDMGTCDRINTILANFVKGNGRLIAKSRWCVPPELGGYGLIDINVLNTCIKASWINR